MSHRAPDSYAALLVSALLWMFLGGCRAPETDAGASPARDSASQDSVPSDSVPPDTALPDSAPPDSAGDSNPPDSGDSALPAAPPLVIVILADDLGDNLLWAMPIVQERLVPASVRFTRAYTTAPLCCPFRASFLSGGFYPAATGVLANEGANGGIVPFLDTDTLATRLQSAGITTALIGKYLNGYEYGFAPTVPPGWDLFLVPAYIGNFTNTALVRGSSTPDAEGEGDFVYTDGEHLIGWLFKEALAFLDAHPDQPTFLLLTPQSPHMFGTPEAVDVGTWSTYEWRPPSFAEADISDKPAWLRERRVDPAELAIWDGNTRRIFENLASLDRGVGLLLDGLEERGLLDRATVVFTSDNGYLHGEHRLVNKGLPYEEAVRVPLLVTAPGLTARDDARLVAVNLDLPATIAALAEVDPLGDGQDLGPALVDPTRVLRDHVFLETTIGGHPAWTGVVTDRWKYVAWGTGETELYDLDNDPYELTSLHASPPRQADSTLLAGLAGTHRALAATTQGVPRGTVGVPYAATVEAWGGTPPLAWTVDIGSLPPGVTLSADGVFAGTPTEEGTYMFNLRVTDAGVSPFNRRPATFVSMFVIPVDSSSRMARPGAPSSDATATASWVAGRAQFVILARPGASVHVRLFLDDTHDTPPTVSPAVTSGTDGRALLTLASDPSQIWHWDAVVDGVFRPGGVLRPPARSPG